MYTAKITVRANVDKGGYLESVQEIQAEALSKINQTVANGEVDKEIDLCPVEKTGVKFLAIESSNYSENLSYKIGNDSTVFTLNSPHIYYGAQAELMPVDPANLKVSNSSGADIEIAILALWDTTT